MWAHEQDAEGLHVVSHVEEGKTRAYCKFINLRDAMQVAEFLNRLLKESIIKHKEGGER